METTIRLNGFFVYNNNLWIENKKLIKLHNYEHFVAFILRVTENKKKTNKIQIDDNNNNKNKQIELNVLLLIKYQNKHHPFIKIWIR